MAKEVPLSIWGTREVRGVARVQGPRRTSEICSSAQTSLAPGGVRPGRGEECRARESGRKRRRRWRTHARRPRRAGREARAARRAGGRHRGRAASRSKPGSSARRASRRRGRHHQRRGAPPRPRSAVARASSGRKPEWRRADRHAVARPWGCGGRYGRRACGRRGRSCATRRCGPRGRPGRRWRPRRAATDAGSTPRRRRGRPRRPRTRRRGRRTRRAGGSQSWRMIVARGALPLDLVRFAKSKNERGLRGGTRMRLERENIDETEFAFVSRYSDLSCRAAPRGPYRPRSFFYFRSRGVAFRARIAATKSALVRMSASNSV